VAEDEPDIRNLYKIALEDRNHEVVLSEDGEECLQLYYNALDDIINLERNKKPAASRVKARATRKTKTGKQVVKPSRLLQYHQPFDAVILDYRMPKRDGMEVAKAILKVNPQQRIIFASAYVRNTLEDAIKQLKQVVELVQKPFEMQALIDTIEDKEIAKGIKKLTAELRKANRKEDSDSPTPYQIRDVFEGLRMIQKCRTF
jgi:CheY-like chemotaxis protein